MPASPSSPLSRRHFLRQASCAAVGTTGFLSSLAQLKLIGASAVDSSRPRGAATADEYKALVCLFLGGGNDGYNVVVPSDSASHASYARLRAGVAVPREGLQGLAFKTYADGRSYGLNPNVSDLKPIFDEGKIAFLANVGTLVKPTTLADYKAGKALPLQLYSHLDQTVQWQSALPDQNVFRTGWGGRMADLINEMNAGAEISMSISFGGSNYLQVGQKVIPYVVNTGGAELLRGSGQSGLPGRKYDAAKLTFNAAIDNVLGQVFAATTRDAVSDSELLATALRGAPTLRTIFPTSFTAQRLKLAASLIAIGPALGFRRQVFFINVGGYDNHGDQLAAHPVLLRELSGAMAAFYRATVELGARDRVTTFTASDFGRTFVPNAEGTDHAWGNIQWIMGGAVRGGELYGRMPDLVVGGGEDATGRGVWIPTISVDQYSATLARWFGVSESNLPSLFPNLGRFATRDLGFMA